MKFLIRGYSYILLIYTGWRTFDFILSQMPKNDMSFWLSIIFLFSTEIGLLLWHEAHIKHTTTNSQDILTKIMTGVDFVGSLAAGIADMILRQTLIEQFTIPPMLVSFLLYGLPCTVGLNVLAAILFENFDAEIQEDRAEKAAAFEIHRLAMKQLGQDKVALAEIKKAQIYNKMRGKVESGIDKRYGVMLEAENLPVVTVGNKENNVVKLPERPKRRRGRPRKLITSGLAADEVDKDLKNL